GNSPAYRAADATWRESAMPPRHRRCWCRAHRKCRLLQNAKRRSAANPSAYAIGAPRLAEWSFVVVSVVLVAPVRSPDQRPDDDAAHDEKQDKLHVFYCVSSNLSNVM